ncbi:MAG: InlB B-repeat-containing protein [Bacilli bacterium]|nr:InlB B-repeat-containing protein [Bacilli bacterium]
MRLKKKIKIILGILIVVIMAATALIILWMNQSKEETTPTPKKECEPFTGGGYTLYFDTDGGQKIDSMRVCIACSPDSYEEIPTPTKEKDTFEGWYYDKAFKKKVTEKSTKDIKPVAKVDRNGCQTGYKDITIYAKWSTSKPKEEKKEEKTSTNKNTTTTKALKK